MGRSHDLPRTAGQFDGDDSGCPMLHVDMDAFFASVEIRRRPELAHRPVVVGGGHRGVVAAASYEARRYGVRSAMSMSQALRLCPRAVVLPPDRAAYQAASAQVMGILRDVTPLVEPLSLDEAFLDVAGAVRGLGRPADIARRIRARVQSEMGLTCSVGVAPTKFVAKLASARCKPDGLLVVPAARVLDFLHPLPVTALWGVGARTNESLGRLGIRTVHDLAETPPDTLRRAVGAAAAEHLAALAAGIDPRRVEPDEVEKSISSDRTLDEDLTAEADVRRELLRLSEDVGTRVRARGFVARTVGIKIRYADFRTVTRVRTLPSWTNSTAQIYETATELYRSLNLDRPRIRLVGVKCEGLREAAEAPEQLALDVSTTAPTPRRADRAIDALRARFGSDAITSGTLLTRGSGGGEGRDPGDDDAS
ncbi:DNA polymerase IV [Jatrophihabitans endophyticus]|uniref:DNA polymerase IV n=1 Tax=Jatrophihabitans endophyticus TaxID=1206085 RepID=UPI001A089C54|nr:DNA polymerase IV [Jatrophihabitans endophyticus]MBE7187381.1 DNA polymerase IV [Jatrophihabitans endophyticus]